MDTKEKYKSRKGNLRLCSFAALRENQTNVPFIITLSIRFVPKE